MKSDTRTIQLIAKILKGIQEVHDIKLDDTEVFFKFMGKSFSISPLGGSTEHYVFYIYPNWTGDLDRLISDSPSMSAPDMYGFPSNLYPGGASKYYKELYNRLISTDNDLDKFFKSVL